MLPEVPESPSSSPILPEIDEKTMAAFPTGKPREEDSLETVICKTCKRPVLKQNAVEHIRGCIRAKQEKARRKKEARDAANRAKEKDKDGDDDGAGGDKDGDDSIKAQKGAKKSAVKGMAEDGTKKGKKRKTEGEEDKEPKKKKKKEEPKPKAPKPKGPVDVEKQCGVILPNGAQCARSLTCKSHSMGAKRAVPGRSLPYDMLLQAYQKKNQARQQSESFVTVVLDVHCGTCRADCVLQRRPSMQMLRFKMIWRTTVPWTPTRRKTPSWRRFFARARNPWSLIH